MRHLSFSLLALAGLACGGRYEVGAMGDDLTSAGNPGIAGGSGSGRAGSSTGGASAVGGGSGSECDDYPSDSPPVWVGPFAEPVVIWERLSLMVHGAVVAPPSALPDVATSEWAGEIALQAFDQSAQVASGAPLLRRYLTNALGLAEDSGLSTTWGPRLLGGGPVLDVLFAQPLGAEGRVGILSEPEWLTRHPRVVTRGVRILSGVLNTPAPPPPPTVPVLQPAEPMGMSQRARFEQHRTDPICAACHHLIDPFGFALSHFDEMGAYLESDHGEAIDASGTVSLARDAQPIAFTSMEDLAPRLAQSCTVRLAFADVNLTLALTAAGKLAQHEEIPMVWLPDRDRVRWAFVNGESYQALVSAMAQTNPMLR